MLHVVTIGNLIFLAVRAVAVYVDIEQLLDGILMPMKGPFRNLIVIISDENSG